MPNTPVDKGGSTAHFKIPGSTSSIGSEVASPAVHSSAPFYEGLKELLWACGPDANQHQLVTIGIKACIAEGIDTKSQLIAVLGAQGFNRGHVAMVLKHGTGTNASTREWSENASGQYRVLT